MQKFKSSIIKFIRNVSPAFPMRALIEFSGHKLIFPFYHTVSDNVLPHVKHLYPVRTAAEFERDLDILLRYYKPMALGELIRRSKKEVIEVRKPRFLLSFDDGMREVKDVILPILKRKGIPATFFLTINFIDNKKLFFRHKASLIIEHLETNFISKVDKSKIAELLSLKDYSIVDVINGILSVKFFNIIVIDKIGEVLNIDFKKFLTENEPYLTESDIFKIIDDGFDIGAHSMDHPYFKEMHFVDQHQQVLRSVEEIKSVYDDKRKIFAFPFSDEGVSESFIDFIFETGIIEQSFGTSGMKDEAFPRHYQRIPMEVGNYNAKQILKQEYLLHYLKVPFGKNTITRPKNF